MAFNLAKQLLLAIYLLDFVKQLFFIGYFIALILNLIKWMFLFDCLIVFNLLFSLLLNYFWPVYLNSS